MEKVRDGFHSFATAITFGTTVTPDSTLASKDYVPDYTFTLFTTSAFIQFAMVALVCKYLFEAMFLKVGFTSLLTSFLQMVLVGVIPDILVTTLPLGLNYWRLTAY